MTRITLLAATLLLASPISPQTLVEVPDFLESALLCRSKLDPARVIIALQRQRMIGGEADSVVDSINYFKAREPIAVWGLKVEAVFGFDHEPKVFRRGPGTAPPVMIGVVVSRPPDEVRAYLKRVSFGRVKVEPAEKYEPHQRGPARVRASILCNGEL